MEAGVAVGRRGTVGRRGVALGCDNDIVDVRADNNDIVDVRTDNNGIVGFLPVAYAEDKRQWNGWSDTHVDLGVQSCTMRLLGVSKDTIYLHFLMSLGPQTWEQVHARTTVFMPMHRVKL